MSSTATPPKQNPGRAPGVRGHEDSGSGTVRPPSASHPPENMETEASTTPHPPTVAAPATITKDFLLKALKAETESIIKSFTVNLGALSQKVEGNSARIAENAAGISRQDDVSKDHGDQIAALTSLVLNLERKGNAAPVAQICERAVLSNSYLLARRSLRLWPVPGVTDAVMWEGVGDFIHDTLGVPVDDVGQEDIESVTRVDRGGLPDRIEDEVIVTFYDKKKRDAVMFNSPNLAGCIDAQNGPTAGIRLEIPDELSDTFRLLSRFGTRLRARHGDGTKRHIKFDDFSGSLFANIKLPGDGSWTRVSPEMARTDLEASLREENSFHQKRMAVKLVPGPRERLSRPPSTLVASVGVHQPRTVAHLVGQPEGRRPRWTAPDRGPVVARRL